jgi:aminoglycoside phosphotransferase (APT) family kinase protein
LEPSRATADFGSGSFTLEQIPDPLAARLPDRAHLSHPPQGMTSDVAIAVGDSGAVVLKRCRNPIYLHWLRREHAILRALEGLGLPVPVVIDYLEVSAPEPEIWLAMSQLPGRSLWDVILNVREEGRGPLLHRLGRLLRCLHSTPAPAALRKSPDWATRKLSEARQNLSWCDGTEELLATLQHSRPLPVPEVLIHGDLALDNVLIDESGELSLIDWSGGDSGDPRNDVALALQTEPETTLTEDEVLAFYKGYGCAPLRADTRRWFVSLYEFF